jgi:hypothetical protein
LSNISSQAPIFDPVVDTSGKANLSWVLFFNKLSGGDSGTSWTPNFVSLTETGGAAGKTGKYYKLSNNICFFRVTITPVTSTSSTAGTTYIDNFPLTPINDGLCGATAGTFGGTLGVVTSSVNRIYTPGWSGVSVPVNVYGFVEVQA